MKKIIIFFVNSLYFLIVIALALSITTIAITRKVNESKAYINNLHGSVVKEKVVVLTLTRGVINTIFIKNGQVVKKGDTLVKMSNPILENNYKVYQEQKDNTSAQTQASIAKISLDNLTIKSPVNGVIGEIYSAEGSSVGEFEKVLLIYSTTEIRLEAELTAAQYEKIQKLSEINAYSQRLNQNFILVPGLLKAHEETPRGVTEKKIGLYFTFKDNKQAEALLNNEDLQINLEDTDMTQKPIDIFSDFWNGLLAKH